MSVDKQLLEALECMYEETKSYIEVNSLGDSHHNQSMKLARAAIRAAKSEAEVDVETRWIEIKEGCEMPEEFADILYVVKNRGSSPYVVHGQRNYEENSGWWWCDKEGAYDDTGNDPGFSTVTHWQPLPPAPPVSKLEVEYQGKDK